MQVRSRPSVSPNSISRKGTKVLLHPSLRSIWQVGICSTQSNGNRPPITHLITTINASSHADPLLTAWESGAAEITPTMRPNSAEGASAQRDGPGTPLPSMHPNQCQQTDSDHPTGVRVLFPLRPY